ncbi:putative E3 SUMO-protein ligase RNF212 isoform X6 [Homo sapiens]|uniref:putative E3 SUMO-protein ligase RNF212 isoform X6 n=1 Tax=Homo sapiens TaxID=9606 RepID=UPI0005D03F30|nr:probable E3 SUMO-protein ligase RNF212 isoform X6 [Homo sapiens]XP_054205696.1 probable E3 SUMO-protein ligase RNF212 isoform X6 [Homo sapiens]|eukprot:XP_011511747.1 probable E3 SUMO-protein ligase RNF212 isoform X5 [Homo sapiens]
MANWVFCNRCFQPPHRTSCFSLTNCGHVYCDACLGKGKKNECLICKAPCRTVLLSKHTDADIQAFFMSIDSLCKKYSRETSQSEIAAGPARISMISPPQDGRMGPHLTASFCFIPWLTLSKPPVPGECVISRGSPCFCIDVCPHWLLLLAFSSGRHGELTNSKTLPIYAEVQRAVLFPFQQAEGTLDTFRTPAVSVVFPLCQFERKKSF